MTTERPTQVGKVQGVALATVVDELDGLLRETYALWEPGWVTFNWRGYTYDHVQRVRALAVQLARREGADTRVVNLAALLHDITKPYDGEYLLDGQGNRIVDDRGLWRNVVRRPSAENEVTALFDCLGQAGEVHNVSGAAVAYHLLRKRHIREPIRSCVAQAIEEHLLGGDDRTANALGSLEGRCLYDADTIDANIGLPAFVRNIYIHLHFYDARRTDGQPSIDTILRDAPLDYLRPYIRENLVRWVDGKQRDFIPSLLTASARDFAQARVDRLRRVLEQLSIELDDLAYYGAHGAAAVVLHYMRHRQDPSIADETAYLANGWLASAQPTPQARALVADLQREMAGEA